MGNITFLPLSKEHVPLLLRWRDLPHVKSWYHNDIIYSIDALDSKRDGCLNGVQQAREYIINCAQPVGYIRYYDAYARPREPNLVDMPKELGAIDIFIAETDILDSCARVIKEFTKKHVLTEFNYAFLAPDCVNELEVDSYEQAGFKVYRRAGKVFWMLYNKSKVRLSISDLVHIEVAFRKIFLESDHLWIFGSRTDLASKGGDIDIYIETEELSMDKAILMKSKFWGVLQNTIGEQRLDIVLNMVNISDHLPIYNIAKTKGVQIV